METSVKSNTQTSPCKNPYSFAPAYVNKGQRVLQSSDAVFGESIGKKINALLFVLALKL